MQGRAIVIVLFLLTAIFLIGCGKAFHLKTTELAKESPWKFHHGDLEGQNAIEVGEFNGSLDVLWEQGTGSKPAGPLTIYNGLIIHPGATDKIRIYEIADGSYRGRINSRGTPQTGLILRDTVAYYSTAPSKNILYAYNLKRNRRIWTRSLRDAVYGTILYKDNLIVGSRLGSVLALDPKTGDVRWTYRSQELITTPPVAFEDLIFVATDEARLLALSADSGRELYSVDLDATVVSSPAIDGLLYVGDVDGRLYGIDPSDGSIRWKAKLDGSIWSSPAVAGGLVFVGHKAGGIVAVDGATGEIVWRHQVTEVIRSSPVVVNGYVVVGTLGGKLVSLRADNGELIEERQFRGGIAFGPISDGKRVYVATERGDLIALGDDNATNISEAGQ